MSKKEKKRHSAKNWRKTNLRHGYTTSACAAACSIAGLQTLMTGEPVEEVTIDLPGESAVTFKMARCEINPDGVLCGTIKDAGDDPDITHGAEIQSFVSWTDETGITLEGGVGVGVVTKPGLPLEIGEPAINPVPRRLIVRALKKNGADILAKRGIRVEIRVPDGEKLAAETLNPRLGILGGISILGTTGIVKPFSLSAYRASIYIELKVARSNGVSKVALTTGSRSEQYAMELYPELPELAFIQVGDHIDYALKQCRRLGIESVIVSGMIGKLSKLAQGRMQTHISRGGVDFEFLGDLSRELGASEEIIFKIRNANTAHHVQNILNHAQIPGFEEKIVKMTAKTCLEFIPELREVEILLFTIKGELLARQKTGMV